MRSKNLYIDNLNKEMFLNNFSLGVPAVFDSPGYMHNMQGGCYCAMDSLCNESRFMPHGESSPQPNYGKIFWIFVSKTKEMLEIIIWICGKFTIMKIKTQITPHDQIQTSKGFNPVL